MPISRLLRFPTLIAFVVLGTALPTACGSTDDSGSSESGGSGPSAGGRGGAPAKAGSGGSIAGPNAALCDQQTPLASQPCTLPAGTVCPTARGNCACTAGAWKCYEIAAGGAPGAGGAGGANAGGNGGTSTGGISGGAGGTSGSAG